MNKRNRSYYQIGLSSKLVHGASVPKDGRISAVGNSLQIVEFPKGSQPSKRTSKWRGAGDPLNRGKK